MSAVLFLKDQLVLIALLVLVVLVLLVLALVVRAATRNDDPAVKRRGATRLRSDTLRNSFRQAVELIEAHLATRAQRYNLPWVLVLDEGNGDAMLPLGQAGIASALGTDAAGSAATEGLSWHFFDKGVAVDVLGACLGGADSDDGNERPWDEFLGLCRDYRPERPFDAIVLTVPAALLLDSHPDARLELARLAKRANRRLWLAQNRFAMRFGLYVVVSGCERIAGFPAWSRALPELLRGGMLGWSSPYDLSINYRPDWVEDAVRQTVRTVTDSSAELFAGLAGDDGAADYFLLPSRIDGLRPQLQLYVDELMRPSSYHEPFLLRGLYFCGDASEAAQIVARGVMADGDDFAATDAPEAAALPASARQPVFLRDLFEQKVFAEIGLTRPSGTQTLGRPALGRGLRWTAWGIAGAWALGLCAATVIVHAQSARLQEVLASLDADSETQLRAAREGQTQAAETRRRRTLALVHLMGQLDNRRLWSVFMPGSWPIFDPLPQRLRQRFEDSFAEVAVASLRQSLYDQGARLSGVAQDPSTGEPIIGAPCGNSPWLAERVARPGQPTLGFEDLREFTDWLDYLSAVEQLDQATLALQRLFDARRPADGRDLALAIRLLYGVEVPGSSDHTATLFRTAAAGRASLGTRALAGALQCGQRRLIVALRERAFDRNDLVGALRDVNNRLAALEAAAPGNQLQAWRELQATLDGLNALIAHGGGGWLRKPGFQPGPAWDRALARVNASYLLGADGVRVAHDELDAGYPAFAANVAQAVHADQLADVAWNDKEARWEIAPAIVALRGALADLLAQPWAGHAADDQFASVGSEALVAWDVTRLDQALTATDLRKRAQAELLPRFPADVRPAAERLVDEQLAAFVGDQLAAALIPGGHLGDGAPAALDAERNRLARVQLLLDELGARALNEQLRMVLARDSAARLRRLDNLLDRAELYTPQDGGFRGWQGEKGPVLVAFGMPDAAALGAYLGQQRARVEALSAEADLLLATTGSTEQWRAIGRDLERYRLHNPNSSLLALENFLGTMGGDVDGGNCAERLGRVTFARSGDFFAQRQQQLVLALRQRCGELRNREQREAWQSFAGLFNRSIAGRPPFAGPGSAADAPALDADEIAGLLGAYDRAQRALRDLAADPRAASAAGPRRFLDQFERVRGFLQPLIPADDVAPGYDLSVEFRANPAGEIEGNKIIDWSIDVGGQHLGWRDAPRPLRWEPGQPIAFNWRLAKDGPAQPLADERQPGLQVGNRSVSLRQSDGWALMSLLAQYREAAGGTRGDVRGQLLRFEFPLAVQADTPAGASTETRARVYVRLTVSAAGKRLPLAWPGAFPSRAPEEFLP
ncbi:type VI secretion system protein [Derxia lacustris]|uniref:type VI secretion system protein n=1 Tax=Derxia lacustris TaxID=764842 RepID=UPI000A170BCF|nr:type VI secretion system protein [Derxia lacustris]